MDGEHNVVKTSIIVKYLQLVHPGPVRLLPADPMVALDVRFLDRFFDLHVMSPVQHAVGGAPTGDAVKRREVLTFSGEKLEFAFAWLERQLVGKAWMGWRRAPSFGQCLAAGLWHKPRHDQADHVDRSQRHRRSWDAAESVDHRAGQDWEDPRDHS